MCKYQIKVNGRLLDLDEPIVMGIVNLTPDSFFQASRLITDKTLLNTVEKMLSDGAAVIDFGGYSTRPQAEEISSDTEIERLSRGLEVVLKKFPGLIVSVDTFRASVAREMVKQFDVAIINDIGGGTLDDMMFETIADLGVAYILMHMRGTPQNMQQLTGYENVVSEVLAFLQKQIARLRLLGVNDVIADPGFGFAKTAEQNFELLNKLNYFQALNVPVLAGLSRKSMIYKSLGITPDEALYGTTALNMLALTGGASILRVHDVKPAVETVRLFQMYKQAGQ
jgi:dihydropteroate synthase